MENLTKAIEFARAHGMKVVIVEATGRIVVTYPSGESTSIPNDDRAPGTILNMTYNLL